MGSRGVVIPFPTLKVIQGTPAPTPEEIQSIPLTVRMDMAEREIKDLLYDYFAGESVSVSLGCLEGTKMSLVEEQWE